MKRIFLLIVTNLAIVLVLGIIARLIGVDRFITTGGMNYAALLGMASIMGFGGAFISLALSKWMAKMTTGAQVISEPQDQVQYWLMNTVRRQAAQAGIGMPEVAIFDSPEPNAFATGMSKNNALVAVSTGLINTMTQDEVEAVLGHEISHVANGDMITLTLVQGVMNTFVYFLARVIGYAVDRFFKGEDDHGGVGIGYYVTSIVMELTLGILAGMVVAWVSRQREFRADAGGAHLAGSRKMVDALRRLQSLHDAPQLPGSMAAFGVSGGGSKLGALFASHPPLEDRIRALQGQAR